MSESICINVPHSDFESPDMSMHSRCVGAWSRSNARCVSWRRRTSVRSDSATSCATAISSTSAASENSRRNSAVSTTSSTVCGKRSLYVYVNPRFGAGWVSVKQMYIGYFTRSISGLTPTPISLWHRLSLVWSCMFAQYTMCSNVRTATLTSRKRVL